jgi:RHS repeat-associated protein
VAELNQAPVITSTATTNAYVERPYSTRVTATDPNAGDTLAFSLTAAPPGMTIEPLSGLITWTPSTADIGTHDVMVKVSDQKGAFATQSFVLSVFDGPPPLQVPNVLRMTEADARAAIEGAGLGVGSVFTAYSESVPQGLVISQNPTGGTFAPEGTPVNIVISLGRGPTTVPNVVGLSEAAATSALETAVLEKGSVTQETSTAVPAGLVATQSVAAGTSVPRGTSVGLVISLGAPVSVPDVVGLDQASAESSIGGAGLTVGALSEQSSMSVPLGKVISQSPAAGSSVVAGSVVSIVVSTGPPPVTVPNVVGQQQAAAEANITAALLAVGSITQAASTTVPVGEVMGQSPAGGSSAPQGSAVDLVVSSGNTVSLVSLSGLTQAQAEAAIVAAGLAVGSISTVESSTVPRGYVVDQSPSAGTSVPAGSAIDLSVSSGPAVISPSLAGLTQSEAEAAIGAAGLVVGTVTQEPSSTVPAGFVLAQSPAGAAVVIEGSAINLVVSLGPAPGSDLTRPVVSLSASPAISPLGGTVTLTVTATDPEGVVSTVLKVNGVAVALLGGGATYTSATPGVFTAEAFAYDLSGNEGYASTTFRFRGTGDTTPPTAIINLPTDAQEITMPVAVSGTATDETQLVAYRLEASEAGKNQFFLLESGAAPVTNGVLGNFDPTRLLNGFYDLRLTAEDASGNSSTDSVTVEVDGAAKIGHFSLSFDDLVIPMAGIPITVTRTYDSRVKTKGDFGVGWTLSVKDIQVFETGTLGNQWRQNVSGSLFTRYTLSPTRKRQVSVRFPDGRLDTFDMVVSPSSQTLLPIQEARVSFVAANGKTTAKLESLNDNVVIIDPPSAGNVTLRNLNFNTYDPSQYRLTDKDGTVYVIAQGSGLESITDLNGNRITFSSGGIIHSAGESVTFTRDAQGRITEISDPSGNAIRYTYDAYGDLITVTDQDGNPTRHAYDRRHNLVDIINALGVRAVRNEYDDSGRWIATVDANGTRTELAHDLASRREEVTNRLGEVTVYEYDLRGNVVATTDHLNRSTSFAYDDRDNLLSETDPLGHTTTFTYDAGNNLLTRKNALGQTERFTYNLRGQVLTRTDPAGRVTTFSYGNLGNLSSVRDPAQRLSSFGYDLSGNRISITDALGRTTHNLYDSSGRQTAMINALGETTSFGYDAAGNTTAIVPPGRPSHGFSYSPAGLETIYAPPALAGVPEVRTLFGYDAAGRLTEIRRPDGAAVGRIHDGSGRLLSQSYPSAFGQSAGTVVVSYSYDDEDKLLSATAGDGGTVTSSYELTRPLTTTWSGGEVQGSVERGYDAAGRLSFQGVNGGFPLSFGYDQANRLIGVGAMTIGRDPLDGRLTGSVLGQVTENYSYTPCPGAGCGDLVGYSASAGGSSLLQIEYVRDGLGRIATRTESVRGGPVVSYAYAYDAAGRLTEVSRDGLLVARYAYDANGNRVSGFNQSHIALTGTYDAQDRLLSLNTGASTTNFTYTPNGELSSKVDASTEATTSYAYDVLGNLLQVVLPDGRKIEYVVDGLNRRIGKKVNGVLVQGLLYQDLLEPVAELDGSGNVVARFVYASKPHVPDYLIKGGATYRIVSDHLGSVRLVIDTATGDIAQRIDYDEFGNVLTDTNPGFQPFGFAGGLYDPDTKLVRFGARDYDAAVGRWTTKDPIGFEGGDTNLYAYVNNDPVNRIDPEGTEGLFQQMFGMSFRSAIRTVFQSRPVSYFFGKSGILNTNPVLRVGLGRGGPKYAGKLVFRASGNLVQYITTEGHIVFFHLGPL